MTQQLSPEANAVLTAVTLTKYDVPPEGLPSFAEEMAPLLAAALRAAADQVVPPEQKTPWGSVIQAHAAELRIRNELLAIAAVLAEPEPSTDRPDRLRVGDVWEFWTEVNIKGKTKPVDILLQWEVVGWHNGQYAWELQSLDGEHKTYLMEFAPSYEEMRFIRSNETKTQ